MTATACHADFLAALANILPAEAILARTEDTAPYECDGLTAYREAPLCVVLPDSRAQVEAILKLCHAEGVPVVARGAGTGLSGGALGAMTTFAPSAASALLLSVHIFSGITHTSA